LWDLAGARGCTQNVLRLVLFGLLVARFLPAGAAGTAKRVDVRSGISVVLPAGWRLVDQSITECSDPAQRLLLAFVDVGRRSDERQTTLALLNSLRISASR
jgi:hypothetical protein